MTLAAPLPTDDADRYLIAQIRSGQLHAWKQLIDRYHGRLAAFARSRLGSTGESDDVVQEAFVGFLTSLPHFDEARSLETYLFSILRYKIGEYLARRKRAPEAFGFDPDELAHGVEATESDTPSRAAARRELSRRQEQLLVVILRRLIDELVERQKLEEIQMIELLFYVGLRNKDVAARMGRDEKAVAGVKFRALARLREYVDEIREREGAAAALDDVPLSEDATIARIWREHRLTCPKRSTLGSALLGLLDDPWQRFIESHLETVGCLMCRANRDDLAQPAAAAVEAGTQDRIFQSSVGFLSKTGG